MARGAAKVALFDALAADVKAGTGKWLDPALNDMQNRLKVADQADLLAGVHVHRGALEEDAGAAAQGDVVEAKHGMGENSPLSYLRNPR